MGPALFASHCSYLSLLFTFLYLCVRVDDSASKSELQQAATGTSNDSLIRSSIWLVASCLPPQGASAQLVGTTNNDKQMRNIVRFFLEFSGVPGMVPRL